jgi:Uma2 family endonuclease
VRSPDVAFAGSERVPASTHDEIVFAELAPDLVIEVRSPRDRAGMLRVKVADWLRAGVRLVWLIDPRKRSAQVFRADGSTVTLTADEAFDGEDVLPGLRVPLRRLLSR